jgi:hypothetical protein
MRTYYLDKIQLQDVQSQLSEAKLASTNQSSAMLELTQEFQRQQESVQKRLMIVTSSDSPKEATRRIKAPLEKLHRVELANNYVELLKDVEELKKQAREHLPADPKGALVPYTRLKELAVSLQQLQDPTEGAAIHLVNHVLNTSNELWTEMKKIMSDEFEAVLQKSKWPDAESEPTREWSECFEKLLDLQGPELIDARGPVVLLPMAVLVKTFVMQFKYHFFSDKPTNHPHQVCSLGRLSDSQLTLSSLGTTSLNGFYAQYQSGKVSSKKTLDLFWQPTSRAML